MKSLTVFTAGVVLLSLVAWAAYEGLDRLMHEYPELMEEGRLVNHIRL